MKLLTLALFACCALLSQASRLSHGMLADIHSEAFPDGLKHVHSPLQAIHAAHKLTSEDWSEKTAYAVIKFTVPPSQSDAFEEAWLKLESEVKDKEDDNEVFDLKKTSLDNLFYFSYGEWQSVDSFVEHLHSDHFKDFAETADDAGIYWSLTWLEDLSEDLERKEKKKEQGTQMAKQEDRAYILINYFVPPGEADDFVDVWRKVAKTTLKDEKGNRMYSLSSNYDDNTRFYAYGVWDDMDSYLDHFESDHVQSLKSFAAKKDIVWFITPMDKIGNQAE